jgi:hypothetical protein
MRKRRSFDPDVVGRDDSAYWAAALVLALRARDVERAELADRNLRRLGCPVEWTRPKPNKSKGGAA